MKHVFLAVASLLILSCSPHNSHGMAFEQFGPASAQQYPTVNQPRWPAKFIHLVTHESRVYSVEISGSERLYYVAKSDGIQQLIDLFAQTRMRDHEVWIKPGPKSVQTIMKKRTFDYNAHVFMPSPISRTLDHIEGQNDKTYDPILVIHVDPEHADPILRQLRFPKNMILHNEIVGSEFKGQASKPERKPRHTMVMFDDSTPATQFERQIQTRVTLWEKGFVDGVAMGIVDRNGYFQAPFSEEEIARIRKGEWWLTLTTGDWKTKISKDHPRIEFEKLGPTRGTAETVTLPTNRSPRP